MRRSDRQTLQQLYAIPDDAPSPGPAAALQIETPRMHALETEILADLTPQPPYGISWWAPHPGTSRRILISDQLFACAFSTAVNLEEAALHWLEFLDYSEQDSDLMADAVQVERGQFVVHAPRHNSPWEDIVGRMAALHLLGVVRALSGALDCLAGVVIGVVALPTSILRADFRGVLDSLDRSRFTSFTVAPAYLLRHLKNVALLIA